VEGVGRSVERRRVYLGLRVVALERRKQQLSLGLEQVVGIVVGAAAGIAIFGLGFVAVVVVRWRIAEFRY
jgi:hypothetical protein